MATVSLVHAWCGSSWRIGNTKNISQAQIEASSSSLLRCSSPSTSSSGLSFAFSNFPSVICANRGRRYQGIIAKAMDTTDTREGKSISKSTGNLDNDPDHLLILVHGIMASPSDWTYAEAELKRRLGKKFLIYAGMMIDLQSSSCNTYSKTLVGIGEAGKQLADEVMQILGKTKSLRKISFLAHSLGGLFARSAIAVLYSSDTCNADQPNKNCMEDSQRASFSTGEMIAGLEPINFITLATPHLGVRGKRQPPNQSIDGYEHIVNVEYCPPVRSDGPGFSTEAAKAKEATQKAPNAQNAIEYYEKMEEEMIHGLQRLGWKKVDVNFHSSIWPFFAHYYIHVKDERLHSAGMGVIAHVADSIMQEETSYLARDVNFGN
ncbi:uncharacterized protein LOC129305127 isoform X8 [Prosopis cineraria]|uniref:uncharacterized protein LOC129305127 isoform X8 n=1 Tax=Prosopis cineraria TaxID=364024 RepID=UPI00240F7F3B|nr:uncharacterized protein LOC129305127 isoform X8 [Prosopis cineraria]